MKFYEYKTTIVRDLKDVDKFLNKVGQSGFKLAKIELLTNSPAFRERWLIVVERESLTGAGASGVSGGSGPSSYVGGAGGTRGRMDE